MNNAYRHVEENPEIFNLSKASSMENVAKVLKTVAKVICGETSIRFNVGKKENQKD
jgi:hypothetical protein